MSSFGKRKPRIIQTFDDEDGDLPTLLGGEEPKKEQPVTQGPIKFGRSKPNKSSSLRRTIKISNHNDDDAQDTNGDATGKPTTTSASTEPETAGNDDEDTGAPVVVRPGFGRLASNKKKRVSSKLSFGATSEGDTEDGGNDTTTTASSDVVSAPSKKSLSQRVAEKNALRKSALTARFGTFGADEEKPRYSKEYLEELQISTPATPQNLASLSIIDDDDDDSLKAHHGAPPPGEEEEETSGAAATKTDDAMDLDPSELDGAMIVQSRDLPLSRTGDSTTAAAHILTEAEIRERKERRARLAKEHDFISLEDSDNSDDDRKRVILNTNKKPKKSESRLIAEDEDLGEGYDEFVTDGSLALGRKAEREAAKRHRQEMAELIQAAEAGSDAESDDSEAERRAAYEAVQRRAGMDGLQKPEDDLMDVDEDGAVGGGGGINQIPKMKPLPELGEVLARMRGLVQGLEDEVSRRKARIESLEKEKGEILARETEVQEILNQAGAKYQAVMGGAAPGAAGAAGAAVTTAAATSAADAATGTNTPGGVGDALKFVTQSPLRPLPPGFAADLAAATTPRERGLESFGTPTQEKGPDDVDTEMTM
ncbi:nineteen complex-related protein 2-domain-containing protein [Sordaria brevicollis]|uniref:Nineteen complex-related protein 2-domain-containing protein n=1 Tax=Sordaria brevicollis TaxID=83679 RepID=A0AAE0PCR2_SORBR|nr:nineteen complex-related protein 2-domain-containing protein [Sordaria brevicollis]